MKAMPAEARKAMGCAGRQYFDEHFDMEMQVASLADLLSVRAH
jgi:hypothetical protein